MPEDWRSYNDRLLHEVWIVGVYLYLPHDYEEVYEVVFDEDGGFDRQNRKDYEKYSEEERSAYRCSKCGCVLADEQGTPLLKAEDIKRWMQSQEQGLESAESGGNSDDP